MIGFCPQRHQNCPDRSSCPPSIGLGMRCTATSIGGAQTQRDAVPAFSPRRSGVLDVYVMVDAGLARCTENHSTRNRPALTPPRYRFDLEISITWPLARWTPADRPRDPPTDSRDGSREFSLGCAAHPRRAVETRRHGLASHSIAIYADVAKRPSLTGVANAIVPRPRQLPVFPNCNWRIGVPPRPAPLSYIATTFSRSYLCCSCFEESQVSLEVSSLLAYVSTNLGTAAAGYVPSQART